jgi:site-specific recombinase XerC
MSDHVTDEQILKEALSGDPSEELVEKVASAVVDEFEESFPELSRKNRPVTDVLDEFREYKLDEVTAEKQYNRKLDYIETYLLEELELETTEDLSSEDVERYQTWRKYESLDREKPLGTTTLQDDMYLFREFIEYLIKHQLAPRRFEWSVEIPETDGNKDGVDEKRLTPERAKTILEYLRKYHYAGVDHVAMELFCQSGPRKSGVWGRDVQDFEYDDCVLNYEHRPSTPLKNDEGSEREVDLYGEVPEIIQDYLDERRPPVTDEHGRNPLLTKGDGRISLSYLKKLVYKWTRPCKVGEECPHDRDPESCEAAQSNNNAFRCPSSRAPHHIRTGYVTDQKNRGVSSDAIEQRCDASPRVQDRHYDLPDQTEERERYDDEFTNAESDPDSGFNHS